MAMEGLFRGKEYSSIAHAWSWIPLKVGLPFPCGLSACEGVAWTDWEAFDYPLRNPQGIEWLWRYRAVPDRVPHYDGFLLCHLEKSLRGVLGPLSSLSWRNLFGLKLSVGQISGGWLVTGNRSLLHAVAVHEEKWWGFSTTSYRCGNVGMGNWNG